MRIFSLMLFTVQKIKCCDTWHGDYRIINASCFANRRVKVFDPSFFVMINFWKLQ